MTTLTARLRSTATLVLAVATATVGTITATAPADAARPGVFDGDRRVILAPTGSEGALGVDRRERAVYSERFDERSMFVLTHVRGRRYWLRTAEITSGGEPLCLALRGHRVVVDACDAGAASQLFRIRQVGESGRHATYTLHTRAHRYLVQKPSGAFAAAPIIEGTPDIDTPFVLLDRGRAEVPSLD